MAIKSDEYDGERKSMNGMVGDRFRRNRASVLVVPGGSQVCGWVIRNA